MIYLYVTPSGIVNLIEGDKMPVSFHGLVATDPNPEGYLFKKAQSDLEAAKASSVPVDDQERAKKLIAEQIESLNPGGTTTFIQPGAIYGPFDFEKFSLLKDTPTITSTGTQFIEPVGKLEEKEEQESLWREVDKIFNTKWTYGMPDDVMNELKERFFITRKQ